VRKGLKTEYRNLTDPQQPDQKPPPVFHHFDETTLATRASWSKHAIAPGHAWIRDGENEGSDSKPFDVKDPQTGHRGKAKPGTKLPDTSRAAHEKIASDLAALLELPIPPVCLYIMPEPLPVCRHTRQPGDPYIAVSAWAFTSCDPWATHAAVLTEPEKKSVIAPLSAMWVFDSWISAEDRDANKHVMVASPTGNEPLGIACIDYAFSLSRPWLAAAATVNKLGAVTWQMPFPEADKDVAAVKTTVERIGALDDGIVSEIVRRIAEPWLPQDRAKCILDNLLDRKQRLAAILGVK
jgi:hypothetical protein